MAKGQKPIDINRFLPLRDVFDRSSEDDQWQNLILREVKVRVRSDEMPDKLKGRGLEDSFFVKVRLEEDELKLTGERYIRAVRRALKREVVEGDKVTLLADRCIENEICGFRARISSIVITDESHQIGGGRLKLLPNR